MSDSVKRVSVRLSVDGADTVQRNLAAVGETGERNLRRVGSAAQQTSRELQQVDQIAQRAASRPNFGQMAGQAGFQIQDFSTQVAMGQNAMVAFGTQFAQFAGMFGVGGAIAGAAVTVGLIGAQFLGIGAASDTLEDSLNAVETAFSRIEAQAERRQRSMEREAEAVNRLAGEYRNMGLAQARAESLLVERQGAALDAEAVRMQGALRGAAGSTLERRLREGTTTNEFGVELSIPVVRNLERLADLLGDLPSAAGRTVEVIRQIATESQNLSLSGDRSAASFVSLRNAALDLLPAAARLDEAQRTLAVQTIAVGQAMGLGDDAIEQYAARFGTLADEIMRAATSLNVVRQNAIGFASRDIEQQIADNNAVITARIRGGAGLARATDNDQSRRAEVIRVQRDIESRTLRELTDSGLSAAAALDELNDRRGVIASQAERFVNSVRGRAQALETEAAAARRSDALGDAVRDIERRTQAEQRMSDVLGRGIEVEREAERQNRIAEALQRVLRDGTIERAEAERALTRAITEQMAVEDRARTARAANDNRREADRLALRGTMIGASAVDRAMMQAEARARESMGLRMNDPLSAGQKGVIGDALDNARRLTELERMEAAYTELGRIGEQAFDRIGGAITQAMAQGRMSFEDLRNIGNSVISELMQAFIRLAVINPLKNAFFGGNSPTMGDAGGILGSLVGLVTGGIGGGLGVKADMGLIEPGFTGFAPWGGYRADGGAVSAGMAYTVGERGPERFVPGADGAIVPNAKLGGGNVTFNVAFSGNAGDPGDRAALIDGLRAMVRAELAAGAPGLVRASHDYTMDRISRGGAAARIVGRGS